MSDNQQWAAPGSSQPPPPQMPPVAPPPPPGPMPTMPPPPPILAPAQPVGQPALAGHPQGWTPPPKPGLVPLRPLTLGNILAAAFQVMRRNPRTTTIPALGLAVISALAVGGGIALLVGSFSRIFTTTSTTDQGALAAGTFLFALLIALVSVTLIVAAGSILQALIATEIARGALGEKQTFGQAWARVRGRIGAVIGFVVLIIVVVLVAFFLLFALLTGVTALIASTAGNGSGPSAGAIGGFVAVVFFGEFLIFAGGGVLVAWLGTKLAFVPSIIVLERLGIRAAIARSWRLTRRSFWRTFGILLLVYAMVYIASSIVGIPVQFIAILGGGLVDPTGVSGSDPTAGLAAFLIAGIAGYVVQAFVQSIGLVLQSSTQSLLYLDNRFRKEGLDLELARYVEQRQAGTPGPDPFLPRT